MSHVTCNILSILPYKDLFSEEQYGAIALCVAELARTSYYRSHLKVLGAAHHLKPLDESIFVPISFSKKWLQSNTHRYIKACLEQASYDDVLEIHNRPNLALKLINHGYRVSLFFHNSPLSMNGSKHLADRQKLIQGCEQIYFNSQFTRKQFFNALVNKPQNCFVQHFGFDFEKYGQVQSKENILLFVGKLSFNKGAHLAIEAAEQLLMRHPNWHFYCIAQPGKDKSYTNRLLYKLKNMGVRCIYKPYLAHDKVMQLFTRSAIAMLPSLWEEPFGRVVMEAMGCGCAVVTTNRGGIPEITANNAILLTNTTKEELSKLVSRLITESGVRATLQQMAQQHIKTHFCLKQQTTVFDKHRDRLLRQ